VVRLEAWAASEAAAAFPAAWEAWAAFPAAWAASEAAAAFPAAWAAWAAADTWGPAVLVDMQAEVAADT